MNQKMDRIKTVDERMQEINKSIQDIEDEISNNRREQDELRTIGEEMFALERRFHEIHEDIASYCQGTDFGMEAVDIQSEREIIYREMISDLERRIEERKTKLKTLVKEQITFEGELQNLRRNY